MMSQMVEIRIYRRHEMELALLAKNTHRFGTVIKRALLEYANGNYAPITDISVSNEISLNDAPTMRRYRLEIKDENALNLIQNVKNGYRNQYLKAIIARKLPIDILDFYLEGGDCTCFNKTEIKTKDKTEKIAENPLIIKVTKGEREIPLFITYLNSGVTTQLINEIIKLCDEQKEKLNIFISEMPDYTTAQGIAMLLINKYRPELNNEIDKDAPYSHINFEEPEFRLYKTINPKFEKKNMLYKYVNNGEIIYIGLSENGLDGRISSHSREESFQKYKNADIYVAKMANPIEMEAMEKLLINKHKPAINKKDKRSNIMQISFEEPKWFFYKTEQF